MLFIWIAPGLCGESFVTYQVHQPGVHNLTAIGMNLTSDIRSGHANWEAAAEQSQAVETLGRTRWSGNSYLYCSVLGSYLVLSLSLSGIWIASGLFSASSSILAAFTLLVDVDALARKLIIIRDADRGDDKPSALPLLLLVGSDVWNFVMKVSWARSGSTHAQLYSLLSGTLKLIPSPAHALTVSGSNIQESLEIDASLCDADMYHFWGKALASVISLCFSRQIRMIDVASLVLQLAMSVKGPIDSHALRLQRIGAVVDQLNTETPSIVGSLGPGMASMIFYGCGRFCPMSEFYSAEDVERRCPATAKELHHGSCMQVQIQVEQSREHCGTDMGMSFCFGDPDEWYLWTLKVTGTRSFFKLTEPSACTDQSINGIWMELGTRQHVHVDGEVMRMCKSKEPSEAAKLTLQGAFIEYGILSVPIKFGVAREFVRAGGASLLGADWSHDHFLLTSQAWFDKFSGRVMSSLIDQGGDKWSHGDLEDGGPNAGRLPLPNMTRNRCLWCMRSG